MNWAMFAAFFVMGAVQGAAIGVDLRLQVLNQRRRS